MYKNLSSEPDLPLLALYSLTASTPKALSLCQLFAVTRFKIMNI